MSPEEQLTRVLASAPDVTSPDLRDWPTVHPCPLHALVFCSAVLMAAAPAQGRPKTDVIVLKSGD